MTSKVKGAANNGMAKSSAGGPARGDGEITSGLHHRSKVNVKRGLNSGHSTYVDFSTRSLYRNIGGLLWT